MVLEAREKAEKVGYPVVGEEVKEADNVIDYDVHDEQTKDTAAMINANNQTTTGMATVIPGVNAPKLIASTSIIGDLGGEGGGVGGVKISGGLHLSYPDDAQKTLSNWSLSNARGDLDFVNVQDTGLKIPETGWYQLDIMYPLGSSIKYIITDIRYKRGSSQSESIRYHTGSQSTTQESESIRVPLKGGDIVFATMRLYYTGSGETYGTDVSMSITITKL